QLHVRQDRPGAAFGDQRAALLDERVQRLHAVFAERAANIVGRIGEAEGGEFLRALVGNWITGACGATAATTTSAAANTASTVRIQDDVELRAEIAHLRQCVLAEVLIGYAIRIECSANPALVLRARPAVDVA